jgi:hypothetical protein
MSPKANTKSFIEHPAEGIRTWSVRAAIACFFVLSLASVSYSSVTVIGNWEDADSNDGWSPAWEGSPVLVPAATLGVTKDSGSLQVTSTGGYWVLQWNAPTVPTSLANTKLVFDLTMVASEWPSDPWTKVADKFAMNSDIVQEASSNNPKDGFVQFSSVTAINRDDGTSANLDWKAEYGDANKTYSLDISNYDLTGASWFQVDITIQGGDGTGHFNFDNARFVTPPLALHVAGNKIKNSDGSVVVLRGVSAVDIGNVEVLHGGATALIDRVTNLNDANGDSPGWYTKVFRFLVCPNDSNVTGSPVTFNPLDLDDSNNAATYRLIRKVVDYCAEKDIYAIICCSYKDHTIDNLAEVSTFWTYMAPRFANDSHVLFELYDEPIDYGADDAASWNAIKDNMQTWTDVVRTYAPHNLILVDGASYSHIIGPAATDPIDDDNVVYAVHMSTGNEWAQTNIATCAAVYPVLATAWGFSASATWCDDTITNFGQPLKEFLEENGIGSIAASADYSWDPQIFDYNDSNGVWSLRVGEHEMGGFAKDWMYEKRNAERIIDLTVTKCKVTAGKTQGQDAIDMSGTFANFPDYNGIADVNISITSLTDDELVYNETLDCNSLDIVKGKLKYTYKIPRGGDGAITSLTIDFNKRTFALKSKSIDLTGLACPLKLEAVMGNYILSGEVDEAIVNGKKSIPTRLMRLYDDTLIVTKAKAKHSTKLSSDTLSVKGEIAVADMNVDTNEPNLVKKDVIFTWKDEADTNVQTFTIPGDTFKLASKKAHIYKCSKVNVDPGNETDVNDGYVSATIDLDKCTFTMSISKASGLYADRHGNVVFGINFATATPPEEFDEQDGYTLP